MAVTTLYVLHAPAAGAMKVGIATDLPKRLAGIQNACPVPLTLARTQEFDEPARAKAAEAQLKLALRDSRLWGEWYADDGLAMIVGAAERDQLLFDFLASSFPRYRRWRRARARAEATA